VSDTTIAAEMTRITYVYHLMNDLNHLPVKYTPGTIISKGIIRIYPIAEKSSLIPCQKVRESIAGLNAEASRK
jgi:hypothetical protein